MMLVRSLLLTLAGILVIVLGSHAQAPLTVGAYRDNPLRVELTFAGLTQAPAITALVRRDANGLPLKVELQPKVSIRKDSLTSRYVATIGYDSTSALPINSWLEVKLNKQIIAAGPMIVDRSNRSGSYAVFVNTITLLQNVSAGGSAVDLTAITNALAGKVDIVTGKGLSTLDFTQLYRNRLDSLPGNLAGKLTQSLADGRYRLQSVAIPYSSLTGLPILFSGSYADLTGRPVLFSGSYLDLSNKPTIPTVPGWIPNADPGYVPLTTADTRYRLVSAAIDYSTLTNRPVLFSGAYTDLTGKPVLFSGSYADLTNKPSLFSGTWSDITGKPSTFTPSAHGHLASEITTDANRRFVTDAQIAGWNSSTGSGFSGNYNDLINKPTLFSGAYSDLTGKPTLSTVAGTGSYLDLLNRPTLFSGSYTDLTNKPMLFSGAYADLTGKPTLSVVAGTGSYADLLNKPTLFSGSYSDLTSRPTLFSGSYTDLTNKPTLSTVAGSGSYTDLLNKPSAGYTQAQQNSRDSTQNVNIIAAQNTANATAANLANYAPKTGVANDFQVDGTLRIPTANDRWSGFDGLSVGQTTRFRLGDVTGAIDMVYGQPLTMRAYHGWVIQNPSGGANPALRVNGLSSGQNIFEFYNAANALRSSLSQAGQLFAAGGYKFPDGSVQLTAVTVTSAPVTVTIAANQTALLNAIAAATTPTIISWVGSITLTSDIELRNKTGLELNCYQRGGLYRDNSPNMIIVRGGIKNCAIRGIAFSNQSGGSNGNTILINEEGTVDYLFIEYNSFTANGTENNGIASNSSGGAQDQFVTTHNNIYVRYNKFQGIPRMAVELKNHSADGPTPTWCYNIFIEYNDISDCGTGSADGYGLSLSGMFSGGRMAYNNIVNAKKYSLEGVLIANYVIEHNNVTDITTTSNGLSLSNGYKAVAQIPAGSNRRVIVRNNTFNVKGRSILSYWYNNCEFTRNTGSSQQRNEWIGDDNTITKNTFDVYNDWNAMQFATSNRNRIVDNTATTYYHGGGVYTSSVIFLDANANNNYVRSNTLTRPIGSYNVHIEQNSSVTNDIGTTAGSATNTLNTYVERRAGTLSSDFVQVDTYDALTKLLPVNSVTTVKVTNDEKNNPGKTSEYRIWTDGSIIWQASQKVN